MSDYKVDNAQMFRGSYFCQALGAEHGWLLKLNLNYKIISDRFRPANVADMSRETEREITESGQMAVLQDS